MNWKIATRIVLLGLLAGRAQGATCPGPKKVYGFQHVEQGPGALHGQKISRIAVYSFNGRAWRRIPHQIDQKNAQGDYVLEHGYPFTKGTDDGWFDFNDEFVVDSADFGLPFTANQLPPEVRQSGVFAWQVEYCGTDANFGWVLVVAHKSDPGSPFSPKVGFHKPSGQVTSPYYRYAFLPDNPAILGNLKLMTKAGPQAVIAKSKFQMPLRLPWFLPDLTFEDTDFVSEIESWQTGPLRSIVAVGVKYQAFLGLYELHLFSELVFSPNVFQIPTVIEFVFDPSRYLRPGSGLAYSLTFPEGRGWELDTNLATLPEAPPTAIVPQKEPPTATMFYAQGKRPEAQFLVRTRVDPKALQMVPPPYLVEAAQFDRKPWKTNWKWLRQTNGDLGLFLDFSNVKAGIYQFGLDLILDSGANLKLTSYGSIRANWQAISIPNTAAP